MADLDYQRGSLFPFCTAGWFFFGQPFAIPIFCCVAWVVDFLYERWPRLVGLLVATSAALLLGTTISDALPREQLSRLIGPKLVEHAEIETLRATDSFGDGIHYEGTLLIGPEFTKLLQADPNYKLVKSRPGDEFRPGKAGTTYRSDRAELRLLPGGTQCLFESCYLPPKSRAP